MLIFKILPKRIILSVKNADAGTFNYERFFFTVDSRDF